MKSIIIPMPYTLHGRTLYKNVEVLLEEPCSCKGSNGGCPECDGTGVKLTDTGRGLLDFLLPFIEGKARSIAQEEVEKYEDL